MTSDYLSSLVNAFKMTNNTTSDPYWHFQAIYIVWIVEFLFIGVGNALIALAIMHYEATGYRKGYLVIFGLCMADSLNLTCYFIAGLYRSFLLQSGQFYSKRSHIYCLFMPQTIGWLLFNPAASLMLAVLSLDRLIAVSVPFKYLGLGRRYAYALLTIAYGYCITFGMALIIAGITTRNDTYLVAAPCYTKEVYFAIDESLGYHYVTIGPTCGILSLVLYVAMVVVHWRKANLSIADQVQQQQERKFQRRVTKSVAISCCCTFSLAVVPSALGYGVEFANFPRLLLQFIWLLPNLNPGCNVIIFLKRQPEILEALKAMISCKQMPMDIRLWKANAQQ